MYKFFSFCDFGTSYTLSGLNDDSYVLIKFVSSWTISLSSNNDGYLSLNSVNNESWSYLKLFAKNFSSFNNVWIIYVKYI